MTKLAILRSFGQICDNLKVQELKIVIEVFHMVFGAIYQDHFFEFKIFYLSLHPIAETLAAQDFQRSCVCACGATFMTCIAH